MVLLVRVNEPALLIPPPDGASPSLTVRPAMATVVPVPTLKTWNLPPPLTDTRLAPGPLIDTFLTICGSADVRAIVWPPVRTGEIPIVFDGSLEALTCVIA